MAAAAAKFEPPKPTPEQDAPKLLKTSQRVAANLVKFGLSTEPVEVPPDELGADMCNRGGSIPNIVVCRENIAHSIKTHGYDKSKPPFGIAKDYSKNPELRDKLVKYNQGFAVGDSRWPPVIAESMSKGTLACTHLNVTIRLHKHRVSGPGGEHFTAEGDLCRVIEKGHKFWLLSCDIPDKDAIEISEWRNSDNNNNQVRHEVEHIKTLQRVVRKEIETSHGAGVISLAGVLAKFTQQAQLKVAQNATLDLARCVIDFKAGYHIDQLCKFHSLNVNPNELQVPASLYGEVAKALPKANVELKLCILIEAYTTEDCCQKVRPIADVAEFIKTSDVKSLASRDNDLAMLESFLKEVDAKYEPLFKSFSDEGVYPPFLRALKGAAIRLAMSKAQRSEFKHTAKNGTVTKEKLDEIQNKWRLYVEASLQPPRDVWEYSVVSSAPDGADDFVPLHDAAGEMIEKGYTMGKSVRLLKRVTGLVQNDLPSKKRKTDRKDVNKNCTGKISGYDAPSKNHIYVDFVLGDDTVRASVHVEALEMFEEGDGSGPSKQKGNKDGKMDRKFSFLYKEEDGAADVEILDKWEKQSVDNPTFIQSREVHINKAVAQLGVDAFLAHLPKFDSNQLCVCKRGDKVEVWTLKQFPKNELVICPFSTEIKDRYWTYNKAALFETSMKKNLCLDGRLWSRTVGTAAGSSSSDKPNEVHPFSLFFLIEKCDDQKLANMHITHVPLEFSLGAHIQCSDTEVKLQGINVSVPIATNAKPIPARTRLLLLEDPKLKEVNRKCMEEKEQAAKDKEKEKAAKDKAKGSRDK